MPDSQDNHPVERGRREFLATGIAIAAGLALGVPVIAALCAKRRGMEPATADEWRLLEDKGNAASGGDAKSAPVRAVTFKVSKPDGWRVREEDVRVYVVPQAAGQAPLVFSAICPHAGCVVDFQPKEKRFFCPCHNGTFDRSGAATGGPPAEAGQSLPRYPLKIDAGLLYIEVDLPRAGHPAAERNPGRPV